ncbi:MAG: antitoxin VapB family protein [Candidatus Bathyarchaeota archaeon]
MPKTITIRDDVYKRLLEVKREGESFSELFERLIGGVGLNSLEVLRMLRGCVEFKDKERLIREIYAVRSECRL